MKIAILGAGAFGSAIGGILSDNHFDVSYYDPWLYETTLEGATHLAEYIIVAVPSRYIEDVLARLPVDTPLIIATKGILRDDIFSKFSDVMAISGPGFAADIKNRQTTYLTMTDQRISELFKADYLHFDYTTDFHGVLLCGALKNVYAIMAGIRELNIHTDTGEGFLLNALHEMSDILQANGANPDTVKLYCGQGDLKITCGMPSRNYEFGLSINSDPTYINHKTVEGIDTLARIRAGEINLPINIPIMEELIERSAKWA